MKPTVSFTHIDTACVLIDINGFRILTDPTLDNAGKLYHHGYGVFSRKLDNPAVPAESIRDIDLVLLSHHQHKDNFDEKGKAFASTVRKIISTNAAAKVMDNVIGLENWESTIIESPKIKWVKITATPAQHHPWWIPEFISGKVIGFIIEFYGQQNGVIYITGDTVYFKGIEEVGKRYKIDIGIFHLGSVQIRYLTGFGKYTLDSKDLRKAICATNPCRVIPVHYRGWTHFKENEIVMRKYLMADEAVKPRVVFLTPGVKTVLD